MNWTPKLPPIPTDYEPWTWRQLVVAAVVAILLVAGIGVAFILPAETGRDPTGLGELTHMTDLSSEPEKHDDAPEEPETNLTPLQSFSYSWASANRLVDERSGELAEGASTTEMITITDANVTRIHAILTWQDQAVFGDPQPDTFTLDLAGPAGSNTTTGSNAGANGQIETVVRPTLTPAEGNVTAADAMEAQGLIMTRHPADATAQGTWNVTITLDDVADLAGDEGNAWRLQIFIATYGVSMSAGQESELREATTTITLAGLGGDIEYKVFVLEGDNMSYTWSSTGDVYWDFHGLASAGFESSHAQGTSDGETGTLTAPFNGRHGWYWRNDNPGPVEITVQVRGKIVPPP